MRMSTVLVSCLLICCTPTDADKPYSPVTASGGSTDSGTETGGAGGCEGLPGPPMAEIDTGVTTFCIDTTEVTAAQYQAFLDADYDLSEQSQECVGNLNFEPADDVGTCTPDTHDPVGNPNIPAVCVDWCDALAYCAWAGKHLCGDVDGGPLPDYQNGNPELDQWYLACSNNAATALPYGDLYVNETCNGVGSGDTEPVDVASYADCHGMGAPFEAIFDMIGNASEWIDSCDGTANCYVRGGGPTGIVQDSHCGVGSEGVDGQFNLIPRSTNGNPSVGFRCCSV